MRGKAKFDRNSASYLFDFGAFFYSHICVQILTFDFDSHKSVTYVCHISGGNNFGHLRDGMKNVTHMC